SWSLTSPMRTSRRLKTGLDGIRRHAGAMSPADYSLRLPFSGSVFRSEDEPMRFANISSRKVKRFCFPLLRLLILPSRSLWAQVDLTGEWSPRIYNDGRDIGDYTGIPLNE